MRSIAQRYYELGGEPLHVKMLGSLLDDDVDVIVRELVRHRPVYCGPESLADDTELYIGGTKLLLKALPTSFAGYSRWISIDDHVGWVRSVQAADLQPAVDRKASKVKSYTDKYGKTVLLLVADRRSRSGKLGGDQAFRLRNPGFHAIYFMSRLEFIANVG